MGRPTLGRSLDAGCVTCPGIGASSSFLPAYLRGVPQQSLSLSMRNRRGGGEARTAPSRASEPSANGPSERKGRSSIDIIPRPPGMSGTEQMQAALEKHAHFSKTQFPSYSVYEAWADADLMIKGLEMAGKNPTRSDVIKLKRADSDGAACLVPEPGARGRYRSRRRSRHACTVGPRLPWRVDFASRCRSRGGTERR